VMGVEVGHVVGIGGRGAPEVQGTLGWRGRGGVVGTTLHLQLGGALTAQARASTGSPGRRARVPGRNVALCA
jgi:hypothetical protein